MAWLPGGGKQPGKTDYSGQRRPMTRRSGFKVKGGLSGGEYRIVPVGASLLPAGWIFSLSFGLPEAKAGEWLGFGVWFYSDRSITVTSEAPGKITLTSHAPPNWNKFGSLWKCENDTPPGRVLVRFETRQPTVFAVYEPLCGLVEHNHLSSSRPNLVPNMYIYAPEALLIKTSGTVVAGGADAPLTHPVGLTLKSCNRCGRFLPVNVPDERAQLSFTNHCVANACTHATFGRLRETPGNQVVQLRYGFQLECRFCKKFEVNAPHNEKRTAAQMKEDGARRRGFELLIEALSGGTPQLAYRARTNGRELADDVLAKFGGQCFKCGCTFIGREWHLDHTRPLKLLWPLDETATVLCGSCNSQKRDRAPSEFYTADELVRLSDMTGISLTDLQIPQPNEAVLDLLTANLDWFFDEFLKSPDMTRTNDGKVAGELLVKAVQKVLKRSRSPRPNLLLEFQRRRDPNAC